MSKSLQNFAAGVICIHNHPFGDPCPSKDDEVFTRGLKEVAAIMGISFLDHIIFGEDSFYSFEKRATSKY
jgi:DNA repair protein RadC